MDLDMIRSNTQIQSMVDSILTDETFKQQCSSYFKQIFADDVIDKDDIPLIVNLVLTVLQNHRKIKLSNFNLKPILVLLLITLINEFKGESQLDENLLVLLIEPQLDLVLLSLNVSSCKWCCCGSRPEKQDNVVNKLKVNKIDKQKFTKILP